MRADVDRIVAELIRPLFEADGGDVEVVSVDPEAEPPEVVLRVSGAFRGCPGTPLVSRSVIEPVLEKAVGRKVRVRLA